MRNAERYSWVTREWLEAHRSLSLHALSNEIGCSERRVQELFVQFGVELVRRVPISERVTREWLEARAELSDEEMATELGCSVSALKHRRWELGVRKRRRAQMSSRHCPCGECVRECMRLAMADEPVRCEIGSEVRHG